MRKQILTLSLYVNMFSIIYICVYVYVGITFPGGISGKEPACQCRRQLVRKIPWRRAWTATPVFLPRESHGQRSLVGYSPYSCKELNTTQAIYTHTHTHTHIYMCIYNMYIHMFTHIYMYVYMCKLSVYMFTCVYISI